MARAKHAMGVGEKMSIVSKKEILDLFEEAYHNQESAKIMNKEAMESLKDYAEKNNISKEAMKEGYKAFKGFKSGATPKDDDEVQSVLAIVFDHFSGEDSGEDQVSL